MRTIRVHGNINQGGILKMKNEKPQSNVESKETDQLEQDPGLETETQQETEKNQGKKSDQARPKSKRGVVVDCEVLAVRQEGYPDSKRIDLLNVDTEVRIDYDESTEGFYKIDTKTGVSGFCSKKYISVQ